VAVPAFSRIQNDPERFARYYLRAANLIIWISGPIFAFLFVAADPVIVLVLGSKWREAAPVFQILIIASLGQLLFETILWLFVSRGQSGRLFKLLLVISPIIVSSFAIGLPFGIKGVALSGSLVFVGMFPWMLNYAFRGTQLTWKHLGHAIICPIALCLVGVFLAELALHLITPQKLGSQFLVVALAFAAASLLSVLVPPIRAEVLSLRKLINEFRMPGEAV
jgi:PST family polysaccharide transporter